MCPVDLEPRDMSGGAYRGASGFYPQTLSNFSNCIRCGICYIFCPDMAVHKTEEGYFEADLYYCKGCGICAQECFTGCISLVPEEE